MVVDVTVKWNRKEKFIRVIQNLDEDSQVGLMNCIQNNELFLKLSKEQNIDEMVTKDKDSSIYQMLTLNTKSIDNVSQNWSFSNFDKLNLSGNLNNSGDNRFNEDSKDSWDTKNYQELLHRIHVLERENKIYKMSQNDMTQQ